MTRVREAEGRLGAELGRFLLDAGAMVPAWAPAFEAAPRSLFLPAFLWTHDMVTGSSTPIDRSRDPDAWHRAAFADVPLVTQWDDGAHDGDRPGAVATSSASMPSVVASMLRDLDVREGMRVLEIGTGTGWNAALLAARLGGANVVTVEIDPAVADRARASLASAGFDPTVVTADGRDGHRAGAPYDRIVATAGVRSIPPAWLEQTRAGGMVLAPWGTDYAPLDALVRLTVGRDGSASGHFTQLVEFMKIRAQRLAWPTHADYVPAFPGDAAVTTTELPVERLGSGRFDPVRFVTGLCVRDCAHVVHTQDDGTTVAWFYGLADRSWAAAVHRPDSPRREVYQSGARRLWEEVERALTWWDEEGAPDLGRFGLTVAGDGTTRAWLDRPDGVLPGG